MSRLPSRMGYNIDWVMATASAEPITNTSEDPALLMSGLHAPPSTVLQDHTFILEEYPVILEYANSQQQEGFVRTCGMCSRAHYVPGAKPERCGALIYGVDRNNLTRNFEVHLEHCHPPQFFGEGKDAFTPCEWLHENGHVCGKSIRVYSSSKPYYWLAQHVAKVKDHFALHVHDCKRILCTCRGSFASLDALRRHYRKVGYPQGQ